MSVTTNHYNLIVLGGDIAGLVTAAHAANRGQRVLVIPTRPITGTYRLGGKLFALDPEPVVQLASPAVRRVCEELGLWPQLRREVRPATTWVHWITPGHRLDLDLGARNLGSEAAREWPDDDVVAAWNRCAEQTLAVDEVFDDILAGESAPTADRFWARRFLDRTASRLPAPDAQLWAPLPGDHALTSISSAITTWLTNLAPDAIGRGAVMRLLGHWNRGPYDRTGGLAGLRELLLARIKLKSGDVKTGMRVAEVLLKRGKAVGIHLLGKTDRYGCDHLVIADDPRALVGGALVPEQLPRPMMKSLSGISVAAQRFVLNLELDARGLGPGFDGIALCPAPPSATSPQATGSSAIGTMHLRRTTTHDDGSHELAVCRVVDPTTPVDQHADAILDDLDRQGVLPWARQHVRLMHSPHDGLPVRDGEGHELDELGTDTAMRIPMAPLYRSTTPPILGVGLLPPNSGVRNLHFASRLSLPGLGLEGEFAAGLAAANLVAPAARPSFGRSLFLGRGR